MASQDRTPRHVRAALVLKSALSAPRSASSFTKIAPYLADNSDPPAINDDDCPRRKPRLSRQQRAALKLQGKYMGTMRGLKPRQQMKVKAIRTAKGIRAAIAAAMKLAS